MVSISHLHPMLVHFPIALVTIGFVAELVSILIKKEVCAYKMSFYLLIFGTFSALVAWLTGILFTAEMSGTAGDIKELHEIFAGITVGLLIIASILRVIVLFQKSPGSKIKWIAFAFYLIATITVSITGYFGGTLVYNYMLPL